MYVLVSDYDGTLKTSIRDLRFNLHALTRFRLNRNIFVLNTGRSFESIKAEIDKYNIGFDYLCCNDGAVLFDSDLNVLAETNLSEEKMHKVKELLINFPSFQITSYYSACKRHSVKIEKPIEIEIQKPKRASFGPLKQELAKDSFSFFQHKNSLFLREKSNKNLILKDLAQILNIPESEFYTIGDELNDFEMLKRHHGFRMLASNPLLILATLKTVPEVHHLVKYLTYKQQKASK